MANISGLSNGCVVCNVMSLLPLSVLRYVIFTQPINAGTNRGQCAIHHEAANPADERYLFASRAIARMVEVV